MPVKPEEHKGKKFGMLLVLDYVLTKGEGRRRGKWRCLCDCGKEALVVGSRLKSGRVVSCGCHKLKGPNRSHQRSYTPEHGVWRGMKARCYNPNNKRYSNYAGRGITVCDRWLSSFEAFFEDMGIRPTVKHTLERINNSLGYSKDNCKWALPVEQNNNRTSNRFIEYRGVVKTVAQWAAICELGYGTLHRRLTYLGWSVERALLEPANVKNLRGIKNEH